MALNFITMFQKPKVNAIEISMDMKVRIISLFSRLSTLVLFKWALPQFLMICVSELA